MEILKKNSNISDSGYYERVSRFSHAIRISEYQ